jgi:hypothetical protein
VRQMLQAVAEAASDADSTMSKGQQVAGSMMWGG